MKQAYCIVIYICAKAIKKGKGMIGGGRRKVPLRKQTGLSKVPALLS